jgi:hypothetical protein
MSTSPAPPASPLKKTVVVLGVAAAALFILRDIGGGLYQGYREGRARRQRMDAELAAFGDANARLKRIKESIAAIRARDLADLAEFAVQCRELRPILADWRDAQEAMRNALEELDRDAAADAGWKELGPILRQAYALDAEQLSLVERQIAAGEPLETMPAKERTAYFNKELRPLLSSEVEIERQKRAVQDALPAAIARLKTGDTR